MICRREMADFIVTFIDRSFDLQKEKHAVQQHRRHHSCRTQLSGSDGWFGGNAHCWSLHCWHQYRSADTWIRNSLQFSTGCIALHSLRRTKLDSIHFLLIFVFQSNHTTTHKTLSTAFCTHITSNLHVLSRWPIIHSIIMFVIVIHLHSSMRFLEQYRHSVYNTKT